MPSFTAFLASLDELGLAYDPATRTGVIVSMPAIPLGPGEPVQFVFCLAYDPAEGSTDAFGRLDARFASVPAGTYDASQHIGAVSFSS